MQDSVVLGSLVALSMASLLRWYTHYEDEVVEDVSYREFIQTVKTGDLILISSTNLTRMVTNSAWSHCGIAYWGTVKDKDGNTRRKLFEWSAHSDTEHLLNSRGEYDCSGLQLVPVDYLASVNGSIFWRRITMSDNQRTEIGKAVRMLAYKIRFSNVAEFMVFLREPFASLFDGVGGGMACSHIVAATYIGAGVMDLDRNLSQYTPKCFSDVGNALWKTVIVAPTKMVVGYDTTSLITIT